MTLSPIASNSAVVTPGRTLFLMASMTRRTTAPTARMPSSSSGPLMDTDSSRTASLIISRQRGLQVLQASFLSFIFSLTEFTGGLARSEKKHQDKAGQIERHHLHEVETHKTQDEPKQRQRFGERVGDDVARPPAIQRSDVGRTCPECCLGLQDQSAADKQNYAHERHACQRKNVEDHGADGTRSRSHPLADEHIHRDAHQHCNLEDAHSFDRRFHYRDSASSECLPNFKYPMRCPSWQQPEWRRVYDPVIFRRRSSGRRSRISWCKRSCTCRAPSLAASTTAIGAGVATATA